MNSDSRPLSPTQAGAVLDEAVRVMFTSGLLFEEALDEFKKRWVEQTYSLTHGNQVQTARLLRMHRNTLQRWEDKLHINRRVFRPEPRRRRKSSVRFGGQETATAVNDTVRKGGRGESSEPSGPGEHTRSSGFDPGPVEGPPSRSERLAVEQAAMRQRWGV